MSDNMQFQKIQQKLLNMEGFMKRLDECSQSSSEESQHQRIIKEAAQTDYAFIFQQKQGIFISQAQQKAQEVKTFLNNFDLQAYLQNKPET